MTNRGNRVWYALHSGRSLARSYVQGMLATQNGHLSRDYSFSSPHISHLSAGCSSPFLTGPFHSKFLLQALSTLLSPGKLFAFSQTLSFLLHRRRINPGFMGASHAGSGISRSFEPQRFFLRISSWRPFVDARVEFHLFSLWSVVLRCCSYFDNFVHNGKI